MLEEEILQTCKRGSERSESNGSLQLPKVTTAFFVLKGNFTPKITRGSTVRSFYAKLRNRSFTHIKHPELKSLIFKVVEISHMVPSKFEQPYCFMTNESSVSIQIDVELDKALSFHMSQNEN